MTLISEKFKYKEMSRSEINGQRVYVTHEGESLPSVTTILSATVPKEKQESLQNWRNSIGAQNADKITTEAANRGTRMHSYLEYYVENGEFKKFPSNPYAKPSWYMAEQVVKHGLSQVNEFWGIEVPLCYSGLYAGTTDCVGLWKNKPAIIDFKQSNKPKKREWIDDYFMQLVAYSISHNNMYGTNIRNGAILMAVQPSVNGDGSLSVPQYLEFELLEHEFDYWEEQWMTRVEKFYANGGLTAVSDDK